MNVVYKDHHSHCHINRIRHDNSERLHYKNCKLYVNCLDIISLYSTHIIHSTVDAAAADVKHCRLKTLVKTQFYKIPTEKLLSGFQQLAGMSPTDTPASYCTLIHV